MSNLDHVIDSFSNLSLYELLKCREALNCNIQEHHANIEHEITSKLPKDYVEYDVFFWMENLLNMILHLQNVSHYN